MLHQHRFISPMMDIILGMRCSFKTRYVYLLIIAGQYLALTFTASNDAIFYLTRGLTKPWLGYLGVVSALTILAFEFPTGLVADRWGNGMAVAASMILRSMAVLMATVCYGPVMFCMITIIAALGWTFFSGSAQAWAIFGDPAIKEDLSSFFADLNLTSNLARIIGGGCGAWLASIAPRIPFYISGLLLLGLAAIVFWFELNYGRPTRPQGEKKSSVFRFLLEDARNTIALVWRDRFLTRTSLSGVFFIFFCSVPLVYWQPFFNQETESVSRLGLIWAGFILSNTCGSAVLKTSWILRIKDVTLFRGLIAFCGVSLAVSALMNANMMVSVAAFFSYQFFLGLLGPLRFSMLNRNIPDARRASTLSLINLAESGGSMIGCIVFGYLCSFLTLKWIFVLSVLPLLASFGLAWRIEERPPCGQKTFV